MGRRRPPRRAQARAAHDAGVTEFKALKRQWAEAGCSIPYMGFNWIPLSVIPEIRITDNGIVLVPQMELAPLFE